MTSLRRSARAWGRDAVLNGLIASNLLPRGLRWRALRAAGLSVGRSTINAGGFYGGRGIVIGEGCFINHRVFLDNAAPVTIAQNVSIGPGVTVITGSHSVSDGERRAGQPRASAVDIREGAWIGASVTILPGVTIGSGALVAAGSLVSRDVPANTLVTGVPARAVRDLPPLRGKARGANDH